MYWGCPTELRGRGRMDIINIVPCIQFSKNILKVKVRDRQNLNYSEPVSSTIVVGLFTEIGYISTLYFKCMFYVFQTCIW